MAHVSNNYIDRKRYVAVEGEGSGFGIISGSDWEGRGTWGMGVAIWESAEEGIESAEIPSHPRRTNN